MTHALSYETLRKRSGKVSAVGYTALVTFNATRLVAMAGTAVAEVVTLKEALAEFEVVKAGSMVRSGVEAMTRLSVEVTLSIYSKAVPRYRAKPELVEDVIAIAWARSETTRSIAMAMLTRTLDLGTST